jgi:small subunit ribosomal protein S16
VIADQRAPRDGDFIEIVGHYNPRTSPSTIEFKEDRVRHWLSVGAQPSETVHRLLHAQGLTTVEPPKRPTGDSDANPGTGRHHNRKDRIIAARETAAAAEAEAAAAPPAAAEETADEPAPENADEAAEASDASESEDTEEKTTTDE